MGAIEAGAVAIVNYGLTIGDAILSLTSALSIVTITLAVLFLKDKVSNL